MRSREEEHLERHAGYPPEEFESVWEPLKVELNLTDEDLKMPSAVIAYQRNDTGGSKVTCTHMVTGEPVSMVLPIDCTQLLEWECTGGLVQNVFPQLTPAQREFLMTGLSEADWNDIVGDDEDFNHEMGEM